MPAKLNESAIPVKAFALGDLMYMANPGTGKGYKNTVQNLLNLVASSGTIPVKTYSDITELLANTDIPSAYLAFVTDASDDTKIYDGWALYLYLSGDRSDIESYILISREVGLLEWDMSTEAFPADSIRGWEYNGINGATTTLFDVNGDPIPDKVLLRSLKNGASTSDASEWAIIYTVN